MIHWTFPFRALPRLNSLRRGRAQLKHTNTIIYQVLFFSSTSHHVHTMTHLLPPNLLRLFVPRPPLTYTPALPSDKDIVNRTTRHQQRSRIPLDGVAAILEKVKQDAADKGEATEGVEGEEEQWTDAAYVQSEKRRESRKRKQEQYSKDAARTYNPHEDSQAVGDPFKTLFVSRLSLDTTQADLEKEFGVYGPIEHLRLVQDPEGKSRGYAFIVYEREKDMRSACFQIQDKMCLPRC